MNEDNLFLINILKKLFFVINEVFYLNKNNNIYFLYVHQSCIFFSEVLYILPLHFFQFFKFFPIILTPKLNPNPI